MPSSLNVVKYTKVIDSPLGGIPLSSKDLLQFVGEDKRPKEEC